MIFCSPKSFGNLSAPALLYRVHTICLIVSEQLYIYHYPWRSSHGPGIFRILGSPLHFHQWPLLSFLCGLWMVPGLNHSLCPFSLASFIPLKPASCRDYYALHSLASSLGCTLVPLNQQCTDPRKYFPVATMKHTRFCFNGVDSSVQASPETTHYYVFTLF